MKKLIIAVAIAMAFTFTAFRAFNGTWKNDPTLSQITFTISHLGIADVSGTFNDFQATLTSAKPDFSDASVELTAKIASIDTRIDQRDNHLKSADFFDAEKYPVLTFKSSAIKSVGKNRYKLSGDLTLHGITKPLTLDLLYKGTQINPMNKKQTAGFKVSGAIKRSDFGIGEKFPAPMLSDEVKIQADGEFLENQEN